MSNALDKFRKYFANERMLMDRNGMMAINYQGDTIIWVGQDDEDQNTLVVKLIAVRESKRKNGLCRKASHELFKYADQNRICLYGYADTLVDIDEAYWDWPDFWFNTNTVGFAENTYEERLVWGESLKKIGWSIDHDQDEKIVFVFYNPKITRSEQPKKTSDKEVVELLEQIAYGRRI